MTCLTGHVAVLSPHLDDGVYSLGAAIGKSVRAGAVVSLITVFAGDPNSRDPASPWDRRSGFQLAGEAAQARRAEDRRACALLGATPVWLPFDDHSGRRVGDDELWSSLQHAAGEAETILVPGFPLHHEDRWRKVRAWRAYRSQYRHFGHRFLFSVLRYEARHGGEMTTLQ